MRLHSLAPAPGAKKNRKRVGRGDGSGHGTYSGRGCKGQKSRSGNNIPRGFEGGQLPLIKRLPHKRGFVNRFRTEYSIVNLGRLSVFSAGSEISPEILVKAKIVKSRRIPIKILAQGDIDRPLIIKANMFSAAAKAKIEAAGGRAEKVDNATEAD